MSEGYPERYRVFTPIERAKSIARASVSVIQRAVQVFPDGAPDYMSNHYKGQGGASEAIDVALYDQPTLSFEPEFNTSGR